LTIQRIFFQGKGTSELSSSWVGGPNSTEFGKNRAPSSLYQTSYNCIYVTSFQNEDGSMTSGVEDQGQISHCSIHLTGGYCGV